MYNSLVQSSPEKSSHRATFFQVFFAGPCHPPQLDTNIQQPTGTSALACSSDWDPLWPQATPLPTRSIHARHLKLMQLVNYDAKNKPEKGGRKPGST